MPRQPAFKQNAIDDYDDDYDDEYDFMKSAFSLKFIHYKLVKYG